MESIQGQFLVASPHLGDPNFYRSVVLMVQHDAAGAFGLILNRPTTQTVQDVWRAVSDELVSCAEPIYHGGPVEGPLSAIHGDASFSDNEVLPGIYFSAARDHLEHLVHYSSGPYRFFAGYAGWAGGQLEGELEAGGWLHTAANRESIFADQEEIWKEVVTKIGFGILQLNRKIVPSDPSAN